MVHSDSPHRIISDYAKNIGLDISSEKIDLIIQYLNLLAKWNNAYNLTSVRDPEQMLYRHILDSLSVAPYATGVNIADVGTGPGLPGIPLAIIYPEKSFTLMDSNGKKTRFLTQCLMELKIKNVVVENGRVEAYKPEHKFDQIFSRAFSALVNMTNWCEHLLAPSGEFVAMKGRYPQQEIEALPDTIKVKSIHDLDVPKSDGERRLVILYSERESQDY